MNNILAKRELAAAGAPASAEGLFLDDDGYVCEGIVSNVFWLKEGVLYTPSLETGPLAGITRYYVMELAGQAGITVREGKYALSEIVEADEAFLTNSIQEIVPVDELLDSGGVLLKRFETGSEGSLVRKLMRGYRKLAEGGKTG